jgi:hypothetical protein
LPGSEWDKLIGNPAHFLFEEGYASGSSACVCSQLASTLMKDGKETMCRIVEYIQKVLSERMRDSQVLQQPPVRIIIVNTAEGLMLLVQMTLDAQMRSDSVIDVCDFSKTVSSKLISAHQG